MLTLWTEMASQWEVPMKGTCHSPSSWNVQSIKMDNTSIMDGNYIKALAMLEAIYSSEPNKHSAIWIDF